MREYHALQAKIEEFLKVQCTTCPAWLREWTTPFDHETPGMLLPLQLLHPLNSHLLFLPCPLNTRFPLPWPITRTQVFNQAISPTLVHGR